MKLKDGEKFCDSQQQKEEQELTVSDQHELFVTTNSIFYTEYGGNHLDHSKWAKLPNLGDYTLEADKQD